MSEEVNKQRNTLSLDATSWWSSFKDQVHEPLSEHVGVPNVITSYINILLGAILHGSTRI
jgi:hypothetical protein